MLQGVKRIEENGDGDEVARIIPGPATMTALEAMAAIYRTLPEEAGRGWLKDSREIASRP